MEWLPELQVGWLNGWMMLVIFYLVFILLMFLFPRDVVAKLFDRSGWSRQQRLLSALGIPFVLGFWLVAIFTSLKIGHPVFIIGLVIYVVGFGGMITALLNYKNTPVDQPVTEGLYRVSRNPQWVSLVAMFVGTGIAIGSWLALLLFAIGVGFYHFRILGEEKSCLARYGEPYREYLKRIPRYFLVL